MSSSTVANAAAKRKAQVTGDENVAPNVAKRTKSDLTMSSISLKGVKSALPIPSKKPITKSMTFSVPESSKMLALEKGVLIANASAPEIPVHAPESLTATSSTEEESEAASSAPSNMNPRATVSSSRVPIERIRTYFDESITVTEDKINIVLAALRPKPKRGFEDYKDKMKKQEAAIADLKEILMKTLAELKIVRELSIAHESHMRSTIGEIDSELQNYKRQGAVLESSEARLKDELSRLYQFTEKCKVDLSPLRSKSNTLENKCTDLTERFFEEQSRRKRADEDIVRLEKELREASDALGNVRLDHEEKLEKATTAHREEIASLQLQLVKSSAEGLALHSKIAEMREDMLRVGANLKESETAAQRSEQDSSRLTSELAKCNAEILSLNSKIAEMREDMLRAGANLKESETATQRSEQDSSRLTSELAKCNAEILSLNSKIAEMREDMLRAGANLKESETATQRSEQDSSRLTSELERLKEQLQQKDADLRSAMSALNDERRMANEEKSGSRAEINVLQGRLLLLEEERLQTTSQLAAKREELAAVTRESSQLRETVANLEAKLSAHDADMLSTKEVVLQLEVERELRSRCEGREETERRERIAACAQLLATQTECNARVQQLEGRMNTAMESLRAELVDACARRDASTEDARLKQDQIIQKESEVQQLRLALESQQSSVSTESVEQLGRVMGELEVLKKHFREISELKDYGESTAAQRIQELEERVRGFDDQRRKMHNLIQELRGNVRVFARVRPFLPSDGIDLSAHPNPSASISTRPDDMSLRIARTAQGSDRAEEHSFSFDRTFGPSISQELVFQEVSEFVQSALDGYNVCLFSYGQTGSGKTHTMSGSGNGSMRGIIPRAIEQVGAYKIALEAKGWEYHMEVSYIEIYNETIRDLLRTGAVDDAKHEIKRDIAGNTTVSDVIMTAVDPNDAEQMDAIMEQAARNRSVEKTAMNEQSSRSHSVFTLHLRAANPAEGTQLRGTLSLVDLAGSERLDRSGATGARMKETVAINKSLSSLVDVFAAIGNKQQHVPFRNSKLTYLLQPALSGDGKTLMLVNLSPTEESYFESLCSLRFAAQVNQCELSHYGKPKRQLKESAPAASESSTPSAASNSQKAAGTANGSSSKGLLQVTSSSSAMSKAKR